MKRKSTRIVRRRRRPGEVVTRAAAIRNHCIECMGYVATEVKDCTAPACWLYPYRMGRGVDLTRERPEERPSSRFRASDALVGTG